MEDMRALFWRPGLPTKERSAPRVLVAASTSIGGLMTAAAVVALHLVQYSEVGIVLDPKRMTVDGSQTQIYVGNMLARCQSK